LGAPTLERSQRSEAARAARKEDILNAARTVFAERGFRGTTIADIAEAAGIALGTIYLYFKSKDEVFAALKQRLGELIAEAFLVPPTEPSLDEAVRARVRGVFAACEANRDLVRLAVLNTDPKSAANKHVKEGEDGNLRPLADALAVAIERGWIRNEDPMLMGRLMFGLVSMAVYQAYVLSDGEGAQELCEASADMIVAYLRPQTPA
jgi:TetR/AcrR family fatty acid metabolism transcriptional regulator